MSFSMLNLFMVSTINRYEQFYHEVGRYFRIRMASSLSSNNGRCFDVVIVGGGIVGTSTARQLLLNKSNLKMAIVEKESRVGQHQTGHNSGVIHAGIYYKPGSLKAKLCVDGARMAYEYFNQNKIPYKKVGKLIVACDETEVDRLKDLYERSLQNKVAGVQMLNSCEEIQKIEPNCVGLKAIWSPNTGIVDWGLVNRHYCDDFEQNGGKLITEFEVEKFQLEQSDTQYPILITGKDGRQVRSRYVIAAAGLHSDKVAQLTNGKSIPKIIPFRGEYLVLKKSRSHLVKTNIYPVPDPRFPFLGVHFTPRMDGSVWVGPNAVLAFKREGYSYRDFSIKELFETLSFSGFRKLAYKYMSAGADEFHRSISVKSQLKRLQRFVPSVTMDDIDLGQQVAGVRAQALDQNGNLVDDFVFEMDESSKRVLHVRNAPSPAATSSLAIAKVVAEHAQKQFDL